MPYKAKYGLYDHPFERHADPRYFYFTDQHKNAMKKSQFVADNSLGLGVTYGSPGTGKTSLSRILFQRFQDSGNFEAVMLANPDFKTDNRMLRAIINEFDVGSTQKAMADSFNIFEDYLNNKVVKEGKKCLLIIDHADRMQPDLFGLVSDLLEVKGKDRKGLLQVLMFGRHELREKLQDPRSKLLDGKVATSSTLEHFSYEEMVKKLTFRLFVAGLEEHPFTDESLQTLFIETKGNPRAIVRVADMSLRITVKRGDYMVERSAVLEAIKKIGLSHDQLSLPFGERPKKVKKGNRGRPPKPRV